QPVNGRYCRARAGVDENMVGADHITADAHRLRAFKSGVFAVNGDVLTLFEAVDQPVTRTLHNRLLPRHDRGKIDRQISSAKAEFRAVTGGIDGIGAADHRLAGRATVIHARAAELPAFGNSDLPTGVRQRTR